MARTLLACCALILLSACGQKGVLQLPDKPGEVVNTPAAPATTGAEESGKEKEDSARPRQ